MKELEKLVYELEEESNEEKQIEKKLQEILKSFIIIIILNSEHLKSILYW